MDISESLIKKCQERVKDHQVEGFVLGKGPVPAPMMFVGEAPGAKEIEQEAPFVGQAGRHLSETLASVGIERDDVYITSAFRSRPYKQKQRTLKSGKIRISKSNRPPTQKEIDAHAPLLDVLIEQVLPQIIVPLGNVGLRRLLGKEYSISKVHGQLLDKPIYRVKKPLYEQAITYEQTKTSYLIFPMYHPAAVIYRRQLKEVIEEDLGQLSYIYRGVRKKD